ncbi:MAG: hypothetical protein HYX94_10080 [Chloroflexi bacterium]|nr:hypothetical protein [Chloroflexota bacterium]
MKLLKARETADSFVFAVHLDEAKLDAAGNPDPAYVARYQWDKTPPAGQTQAQHLANVRCQLKALAQTEAARRNVDPGAALTGEGATL